MSSAFRRRVGSLPALFRIGFIELANETAFAIQFSREKDAEEALYAPDLLFAK